MSYENITLKCFSCPNVYNCKYYKNSLWVEVMLFNQGICAAMYYPYNYIFTIAEQIEKHKNRDRWY